MNNVQGGPRPENIYRQVESESEGARQVEVHVFTTHVSFFVPESLKIAAHVMMLFSR